MVYSHERSESPSPDGQSNLLKRLKMNHISSSDSKQSSDPTPHFAPDLLSPTTVHRLHLDYDASEPFKHCIVEKLFQDDLLKGVKDECLSELSFTEKETDIYKVLVFLPLDFFCSLFLFVAFVARSCRIFLSFKIC